jgi:hypothetical protein
MKLFLPILSTVTASSPNSQLSTLVGTSNGILSSNPAADYAPGRHRKKWDTRVNRWDRMMKKNVKRLERKLEKCGNLNGVFTQVQFVEDVCTSIIKVQDQVLSWSDAYLSECSGEIDHQQRRRDRMVTKFTRIFQCPPPTPPTCSDDALGYCYTLESDVADYWENYSDDNLEEYQYRDFSSYTEGAVIKVSKVCNPNWVSRNNPTIDCEFISNNDRSISTVDDMGCDWHLNGWFEDLIFFGNPTANGIETWLNCPQCGCVDNNPTKW